MAHPVCIDIFLTALAALAAFRRMRVLRAACTCALLADDDQRCAACKEWWAQHSTLHDEVRCKPWDWPCIENPDVPPDWPSDLAAQARWRALWRPSPRYLDAQSLRENLI